MVGMVLQPSPSRQPTLASFSSSLQYPTLQVSSCGIMSDAVNETSVAIVSGGILAAFLWTEGDHMVGGW